MFLHLIICRHNLATRGWKYARSLALSLLACQRRHDANLAWQCLLRHSRCNAVVAICKMSAACTGGLLPCYRTHTSFDTPGLHAAEREIRPHQCMYIQTAAASLVVKQPSHTRSCIAVSWQQPQHSFPLRLSLFSQYLVLPQSCWHASSSSELSSVHQQNFLCRFHREHSDDTGSKFTCYGPWKTAHFQLNNSDVSLRSQKIQLWQAQNHLH